MSEQAKSARTLPTAAGPWHVSVDGVDIVVNVRVRKWRGEPDGLLTWVDGEGEPYDVEDERFVWLAPVAPVGSVPPEVYARDVRAAFSRGYREGHAPSSLSPVRDGTDAPIVATLTAHGLTPEQAADVVAGVTR